MRINICYYCGKKIKDFRKTKLVIERKPPVPLPNGREGMACSPFNVYVHNECYAKFLKRKEMEERKIETNARTTQ